MIPVLLSCGVQQTGRPNAVLGAVVTDTPKDMHISIAALLTAHALNVGFGPVLAELPGWCGVPSRLLGRRCSARRAGRLTRP